MMDWNGIRVFLAVCEAGSQSKAGAALGLSHATVFRRISALEQDLGARLFERVQGRPALTEAGVELRRLSERIAGSFEEIDRLIAGTDARAEGVVRLTAPRSFSDNELPRYLAEFAAREPEIQVELLVSNQELNMSDRSADVALRVADAPPEHLWGRKVMAIDWALYAAPEYLERRGALASPGDLERHLLIGPVGGLARHPAFEAALASRPPLAPVSCDDLTGMASLAAAGHGVALLPDDLGRSDLKRCCAFSVARPNLLWVLTHSDLRRVGRIRLLMGFLAEAFARDPRWRGFRKSAGRV